MAKKILIIETSLRAKSNSDRLAESFAEGAKAAGNDVEIISMKGKNIGFCTGCFGCQKLGHCVFKDDANEITEKILEQIQRSISALIFFQLRYVFFYLISLGSSCIFAYSSMGFNNSLYGDHSVALIKKSGTITIFLKYSLRCYHKHIIL
ncbi:NADPH-dependent FMN reductase [Lachnospiraceae bacterium XPB1003]|jgi:hypothetical protein|nr:NADPH-dependent FMN reductase [Lachnospiraceae bacterium XPB1003]